MKATIHRSGGVAGLRLGGTIDTDDLPGELAGRAQEALQPERLAAAAQHEADPGAADLHSYEVTLPEQGGTYTVTGSPGAGETAAILDQLVNECVRRRRGR